MIAKPTTNCWFAAQLRTEPKNMKMKVRTGLVFALSVLALGGCDRFPDLFFGPDDHRVVLADKPLLLDTKPMRLSSDEQIKVAGMTTELCATLSHDAHLDTKADAKAISAEFVKLKGGAHLFAVLHARNGKNYDWKCDSWSFSPTGSSDSNHGTMSACLRWECAETPPKGTEIASIDLSTDRPLRVLGVDWSSTDAFDFVAQPPPDPIATPSAEYKELEQAFGGHRAWPSAANVALQVSLESNRHRPMSFSHFNSTLSLRLADSGIQLQPTANMAGMGVVTIPTSAVEACSMSCFSSQARTTELLLTGQGIQLGILNAPEVNDWCWRQHIPMATSASMGAWLYRETPLPAKATYTAQFESRAAYDHQAHQSCMGY
jgi:hypothetical protein